MEPHEPDRLDPRPADRPRARAHPLVRPLAPGGRERDRPRAADRALRPPLDAARARPRRVPRRVAIRARTGRPRAAVRASSSWAGTAARASRRSPCAATSAPTGHIRGTYYPPYGLALDQRPDEIHSLVYDWPLPDDLEILGAPVVELTFRSSEPVAFAAARLTEVLPDGTSVLVCRGILNLTHRDSHTEPGAARAGRRLHGADRARRHVVGLHRGEPHPARARRLRLARRLAASGRVGADGRSGCHAARPPRARGRRTDRGAARSRARRRPGRARHRGPTWRIEHDVYGARDSCRGRQESAAASTTGRACSGWIASAPGVAPQAPGRAWVESDDRCRGRLAGGDRPQRRGGQAAKRRRAPTPSTCALTCTRTASSCERGRGSRLRRASFSSLLSSTGRSRAARRRSR